MKLLIGWPARAISYLLYNGPEWVRRWLGNFLGFLWFDLFRIRRKVVTDNIAIAFPEMEYRERVAMGRRCLHYLGHNFVEYSFLPWINKDNVDEHFDFINTKIFDEALAQGRGVLLLTLHLGNGDLGCSALSIRGYPMVMVSKFFKAKWLNDMWFGMRERVGTKFVAPRNSSYALLKALKSNQAVVIPLDQFTGPPIGVRTTFFGVETGTAAGLAVMAQRSKAPVISVYSWRQPNGRHAIEFVREIPTGDAEPDVVTQRFNDELESFVRLHPDQWMWIHKRWKKFKY